jgi:AcrR family transcriptional regulator
MSEKVKPSRRYDSSRRRAQAARTRQDILAAARDSFVEHGFGGTTLSAVAKAAGVAVETIYRSFDGKAGLFCAVVEDASLTRLRPEYEAILDEPDPRRQLGIYAAAQPAVQERIGPLIRVLNEASSADPEIRKVSEDLQAQRLAGMERLARLLDDEGALRAGLTVEEARDVLWTITSNATHDLLVTRRGWSGERYGQWLGDTLARLLLRD